MKKIILLLSIISFALVANAQYDTPEQRSALRTVLDIEKKILSENTDEEATKLINEHKAAKKALTSRLMKADGYNKIKKDKPSIAKFKAKSIKKDTRLAALDQSEIKALEAKQNYISSIDEVYKKNLPVAYP